ncbi:hypothetical protein B0H13DRAFT_2326589 [Mycena leptocephala]|nr:hypothetical protein B0H13DRAFT_2326589 [Mycena leptocephala]
MPVAVPVLGVSALAALHQLRLLLLGVFPLLALSSPAILSASPTLSSSSPSPPSPSLSPSAFPSWFCDGSKSPVGTLSSSLEEFSAALPCPPIPASAPAPTTGNNARVIRPALTLARGLKVARQSARREELRAAEPCTPTPCAPTPAYPGTADVGTGVKAGTDDPGVPMALSLSVDAAYSLSPPVLAVVEGTSEGIEASASVRMRVESPMAGIPKAVGSGMGTPLGVDVRCGVCCYTGVRWEEARGCARAACLLPFPLVLVDGAGLDDPAVSARSVLAPGVSGAGDWTSGGVLESMAPGVSDCEDAGESHATPGWEGRRPEVGRGVVTLGQEGEGGGIAEDECPMWTVVLSALKLSVTTRDIRRSPVLLTWPPVLLRSSSESFMRFVTTTPLILGRASTADVTVAGVSRCGWVAEERVWTRCGYDHGVSRAGLHGQRRGADEHTHRWDGGIPVHCVRSGAGRLEHRSARAPLLRRRGHDVPTGEAGLGAGSTSAGRACEGTIGCMYRSDMILYLCALRGLGTVGETPWAWDACPGCTSTAVAL